MRYPREHKRDTRNKILECAGKRFRRDGYEASGVKSVMADVGLTVGAFYAHFDSKETLLGELLESSHERTRKLIDKDDTDEGIWRFVDSYLSERHRDDPGDGCPSAALAQEIARQSPEVRSCYEQSLDALFRSLEERRTETTSRDDRSWSIALAAMLVGGMALARAVNDRAFSREILESCRSMARRIGDPDEDGPARQQEAKA